MTIEYTTGLALITLSFDPQQDSILHVLFVLCAGQICNIHSFTIEWANLYLAMGQEGLTNNISPRLNNFDWEKG